MAVNLRTNKENSKYLRNNMDATMGKTTRRRIPLTSNLVVLSRELRSLNPKTPSSKPEKAKKKQNKSPSKRLRDIRRLIAYRYKKVRGMLSIGTQTDSSGNSEETQCSEISSTTTETPKESPVPVRSGIDPTKIYQDFELTLQLSRLEETSILTTALRHIVRLKSEKGNTITFPTLEAVDRIQLKSSNLPTNPSQLLELVKKVFDRRGESLEVGAIYKQFVAAHGRIAFNYQEKWPHSHIHTYHP